MNTSRLVDRLLHTDAGPAALALRVPVGIIFAAHGAQKLFGWFGGHGLEGTGQFFGSIGLNPGYLLALLAGAAEFFGGLALVAGLLVRPAAAALGAATPLLPCGPLYFLLSLALLSALPASASDGLSLEGDPAEWPRWQARLAARAGAGFEAMENGFG